MGRYYNPMNTKYREMVDAGFYVDHSLFIDMLNKRVNTVNNQLCVSRPHGFQKKQMCICQLLIIHRAVIQLMCLIN